MGVGAGAHSVAQLCLWSPRGRGPLARRAGLVHRRAGRVHRRRQAVSGYPVHTRSDAYIDQGEKTRRVKKSEWAGCKARAVAARRSGSSSWQWQGPVKVWFPLSVSIDIVVLVTAPLRIGQYIGQYLASRLIKSGIEYVILAGCSVFLLSGA